MDRAPQRGEGSSAPGPEKQTFGIARARRKEGVDARMGPKHSRVGGRGERVENGRRGRQTESVKEVVGRDGLQRTEEAGEMET